MSNLTVRLLTAGVAAPVLIGLVYWPHPLPLWGLVFAATAVGLWEWATITLGGRPLGERLAGIALGLGLAAAVYFGGQAAQLFTLAGITIAGFTFFLFRYGDLPTAGARFGTTLAGALYVGVLLTFLALLKRRPDGVHGEWLLLTLTLTWFGDTGAYFAGRAFGRHKLYRAISPGKTVEGAVGGLLGSILALVIAKVWYLSGTLAWWDCVALAVPAGALGQIGDLCESMIKRAYGVKDSGFIIPGHGGILDRVDALLFSAPFVYAYAALRFGL
ncbi:MAG TPA: phosphatidate cytidylyltransferase [Polyangia bacterium]|jgi:phosphatidate cytidylyltransferase